MTETPQRGMLDGQVAIVTGASSGIGVELGRALASAGGHVVAVARRLERLETVAADNDRISPVRCDVTDDAACRALVEAVVDTHGRIDVLVNNAGRSNIERAEDEQPDSFRDVLATNLVAPFVLAHLVAPTMLAQQSGSIVNIASIVGLVGLGRMPQAGYAASKGGLVNLTRELAAQWARQGIRVNAIAPGWFPTELTERLFDNPGGRSWIDRLTPMGRCGALSELSGALLYLVDPANSYTTGVVIPVDGGWTAV